MKKNNTTRDRAVLDILYDDFFDKLKSAGRSVKKFAIDNK